MTDAFGVVALVALTPLIAIQIMGICYRIKLSEVKETPSVSNETMDDDAIIEIEEELV